MTKGMLGLVVVLVSACGSVNNPMHDAPSGGGDFALTATANVHIVQGDVANATVTLTRNGYTGAVTVAATGLPAGVTADPLMIADSADSGTLVLHSDSSAALGSSATATITGTGGGAMKTAMTKIFVQGPHGALDTTFNTTGKMVVPLGTATANDHGFGVVVMQNGDIVVVGGGTNGSQNFAGAIALTPAGALDTNMFNSGKHIGTYTAGASTADLFFAAQVQPDGKLLAAGYAGVLGQEHFFMVARFTTLGVLDTTFGVSSSGYNVADLDTATTGDAKAYAMTLKPDGSIALGGFFCGGSCTSGTARFTSAGSLVGKLPAPPAGYHAGLAARSDGTFLAVGGTGSAIGIARYTAADALDASFGSAGTGSTTAVLRNAGSDVPASVNLLADNRFYVGAYTKNGTNNEAAVARFTEAGTLDTTFANGTGYVTTPMNNTLSDKAAATAVQDDGSVILAYTLTNTTNDFAWVRVRTDGTIDAVPGVVSTDFSTGSDVVSAVAVQPDGRIILAGAVNANARVNIGVARYWP